MKQFIPSNIQPTDIPTDKIDSYISYMSQVYNVQQYMLIQAQNQIIQAQLLKLQTMSSNQGVAQQQRITKFLEQILTNGTQISISDFIPNIKMAILAKYIANIILYVMKMFLSDSDELINSYIKDPNSIIIDYNEWDLICQIICKKLVFLGANDIYCTDDSQIGIISQSLLFSGIIRSAVFKKLHTQIEGQNSQIILGTLQELLTEENRTHEFLYKFLCEDEKQILTKTACQNSLDKMLQKSGLYFHSSNLIEQIIENQKQFNTCGNFESHAEKYLDIIKIFKNTERISAIEQIISTLFVNQQEIELKDFIFLSNKLDNKHQKLLFLFVHLIRLENSIIQIVLENKISETPQKTPLEYYAKLIEKIKNKCRSKEDEFCNCKRCQCVKRNRDSAREAQKRKREALEKIGPLQSEYEKLEKKVKTMEFDNLKLKQVLFDAMKNPVVENLIKSQYLEILNNIQFEEENTQKKLEQY